ncbi:MAG: glycine cleavage system aminomethyltransferase GcvT [Microbacteriaceae bacterium]
MAGKHTPLHDVHVAAGASFTDFAGFDMPVRYTSDLEEHHAVRKAAGIFDLSHMAEINVEGPDAAAFLDYALSNRLSSIDMLQAKYSLLLGASGGVLDDLIVYRLSGDRFLIVANASNREVAFRELSQRSANFEVRVVDDTDAWALIAVQGPLSRDIMLGSSISLDSPMDQLRYYRFITGEFHGEPILIARTGYTGEDGYEVFVPSAIASAVWADLERAGSPHGLIRCGLACRDTLRLEAGMPLYGHELGIDYSPAQAGLARVVDNTKDDFVGAVATSAADEASSRVLVGLVAEGKRAPRAGYHVVDASRNVVGEVTSGALSPTLGYPIAMAYVDQGLSALGTELFVDVRGSLLSVSVHEIPFYSRKKAAV